MPYTLISSARAASDLPAPANFDLALQQVEAAVAGFRRAFLAQSGPEADAALAYHDRALAELADGFVPLYYRRAVLDNVLKRYQRNASILLGA